MELCSALFVAMAALGSKVLLAHPISPRCCESCVLPVSTRQASAGTPFWHGTVNHAFLITVLELFSLTVLRAATHRVHPTP